MYTSFKVVKVEVETAAEEIISMTMIIKHKVTFIIFSISSI